MSSAADADVRFIDDDPVAAEALAPCPHRGEENDRSAELDRGARSTVLPPAGGAR